VGHAHVAWSGTTLGIPEVQDVFVPEAHRRRGIARALALAAERLAAERGHARLSLSFGFANEAARILYETLGYRRADLEPQRVQGTIVIRGRRVQVDDTLVYLIKEIGVDSGRARSS
jgi:GNAT superfamily N-acetyltransferase